MKVVVICSNSVATERGITRRSWYLGFSIETCDMIKRLVWCSRLSCVQDVNVYIGPRCARSRVDMKVCKIQAEVILSLPTFLAPKTLDDAPVNIGLSGHHQQKVPG